MNNKEIYRELCKTETTIPIFSRDWWLDAACGDGGWDVAIVRRGDEVLASMPYHIRNRYGRKSITMPQLTQTLGPWLRPSKAKYAKKLTEQKGFMTRLIKKLPSFDYFCQNFHYSVTNWLPFYWQGFQQTTRYTYVFEDLSNLQKIWEGMLPKIRTDIKKAQNRFGLQIRTDLGVDVFLDVNELTFTGQGMKLPYTRDFVRRLDHACETHNARKVFFSQDKEGRIHAAVYIVWNEDSAYYLMGGSDPELRNSGANSLCMWEAIRFAATVTKRFDFEGSMIEPVERFFRAFGARQVPYFQITKDNRPLAIKCLLTGKKEIARAIRKLKGHVHRY
ncbi:MAG: GNAT family N-acetyltransferase [Proteobacteria bacterium]|nr:GNAT family N-acetyltransferase [Pseudomonadota bacterium]